MATTDATPEAIAATPAAKRGGASAVVSLLAKGALLLTAAFGTAFAVAYFIPESNDYARASQLKHDRLAAIDTKKIVLVGGSNLSFGVDSTLIESQTHCPVVNMGMNGYFGVRFLLSEVEPDINPGDVVVLSFEYDNFFKSVDGSSMDLLAVAKTNPGVIDSLTWKQRILILKTVPFVAQQKILRLLEQAYDAVVDDADGEEPPIDMADVESFRGFAPNGDLVGHLDKEWPYALEEGLDATNLHFEIEAVWLMRDFAQRMQERGVDVVVSYTPVLHDYYSRHTAALDLIHETVLDSAPLVAPSPPSAYVYERPMFFDTVYHLNKEGRELRTQRLIDDLHTQLQNDATCTQDVALNLGVSND